MVQQVKMETPRRTVTFDKLTFIVETFRPIAGIKEETYKNRTGQQRTKLCPQENDHIHIILRNFNINFSKRNYGHLIKDVQKKVPPNGFRE